MNTHRLRIWVVVAGLIAAVLGNANAADDLEKLKAQIEAQVNALKAQVLALVLIR